MPGAHFNRRFQLLLSDEQFQFLNHLSERHNRSMGELIRDAIEETYRPRQEIGPMKALDRLKRTVYLAAPGQSA